MASTSSTIRIIFDGSVEGLRRAVRVASNDLKRFNEHNEDVDRGLRRIFTSGTKATAALGAVGNAIPILAGVATSATTAAGALLVLPGAALSAGAAYTVLKLATSGFGDAVKASDPAAFAKATKDMAPAAIQTAVAIRALRPEFIGLRKDVQGAFFAGFANDAKALGSTYLPVLRPQLTAIAGDFNAMGHEAVKALIAPAAVKDVNTVLGDTHKITADLKPALANVLDGFLAIAGQGSAEFRGFGAVVTDVTKRFQDWAREAAKSGKITELIREGKDELQKWGEIGANVGGILTTVFKGLSAGGADFAGNLERSTAQLEAFLHTAEGQEALKALGETLGVTAQVVRDVLIAALRELGPILVAAAPGAQEFARVLGGLLVDAIHTVGPLLQGFARFLSENKAVIDVLVPTLAVLVLGFKALKIIQSVATWVGGARAALTGLGTFLMGPWGIALSIAAVALGLFVGSQIDAANAADKHREAVDTLRGTLDKYTGAVTEATKQQKAQELSTKLLADGHTTALQAVRGLGIGVEDYTEASLGNAEALGRVKSQLDAHVHGLISASPQYQQSARELANLGLSLDDLSAAAQGNQPALDKVHASIAAIPDAEAQTSMQLLVDGLLAGGGASAELARELGISNGQLAEAQRQARDAAEASGALKAQLAEVAAQIASTPDAKTITLQSNSPELVQQLRALGFEVTTLPDGKVQVNLEDKEARANFDALMATLNTAKAAPTLDLNTATAQQKADAVKTYIDGLVGIATADANAAPGTQKADDLKTHIDGIVGILTVDGNPAPGTAKANELQAHVNALVGIMTQDGNNAPGTAKGDALRAYINGLVGIMTQDGNNRPGTAQGDALKRYVDGLKAQISIGANASAAYSVAQAFVNTYDGRRVQIDIVSSHVGGAGGGLVGYSGGGLVPRFARGGVIGGFAPGRDTVPALLSPGEAVLVPELVRAIGARYILAANKAASGRKASFWNPGANPARFAAGGIAAARQYLMAGLNANAGTPSSAPVAAAPVLVDNHITVKLGEETLTEMVRTQIDTRNRDVARTVRAGAGISW